VRTSLPWQQQTPDDTSQSLGLDQPYQEQWQAGAATESSPRHIGLADGPYPSSSPPPKLGLHALQQQGQHQEGEVPVQLQAPVSTAIEVGSERHVILTAVIPFSMGLSHMLDSFLLLQGLPVLVPVPDSAQGSGASITTSKEMYNRFQSCYIFACFPSWYSLGTTHTGLCGSAHPLGLPVHHTRCVGHLHPGAGAAADGCLSEVGRKDWLGLAAWPVPRQP
jgi:hypothetical protein